MSIPYERLVEEDLNRGYGDVSVTMPGGGTATGRKVGLHTWDLGLSVKDHGAVGDGNADDSVAFADAIALINAGTYSRLYVPSGTYCVSSGVAVTLEGAIVEGAGRHRSIIKAVAPMASILGLGARRILCRDLSLDGNALADVDIDVTQPNVDVEHIHATGSQVAGVRASGVSGFSLRLSYSSILSNHGHGILLSGYANGVSVAGCAISGNAKNGIIVDTTDDYPNGVWILHNTMENNCSAGTPSAIYAHINVGGGSEEVYVVDNYHENDLNQSGINAQFFVKIGAGCNLVTLDRNVWHCPNVSGEKFDYHVFLGSSAHLVSVKRNSAFFYNTKAIYNDGAIGVTLEENLITGAASTLVSSYESVVRLPNRALFRVYLPLAQTITGSSVTKVAFSAKTSDPDVMFDIVTNFTFTVLESGYYQVFGAVKFLSVPDGIACAVFLYKASSVMVRSDASKAGASGGNITVSVQDLLKLSQGDTLSISCWHNNAGTLDVVADDTYFYAVKVGVDHSIVR